MQLVAYGAQDIYLTGNPQITFFKVVYRRHTNFSMESIEQTFNGSADWGKKVSATISRNGDLIHKVYLEVDVETTTGGTQMTAKASWVKRAGYALIKEVEVEIGGQRIDKHYGVWMQIWSELSSTKNQELLLDKLVGGDAINSNANQAPSKTWYVPLQFWFCKNPGCALPLIALQYHEVKINITFRPLIEMLQGQDNVNTKTSNFGASLYVDYIYLDTDERRRFAQVSHEYLIEQLQFTGEETLSTSHTLNFNHPVKELVWVSRTNLSTTVTAGNTTSGENEWFNFTNAVQSSGTNSNGNSGAGTNPTKAGIKLQLNGHDRFSQRNGTYFNWVQPYQHHTGKPSVGVNVYSFGLTPEEHQPSGTCNFSRIDNAQLKCATLDAGAGCKISIFAVNYNVLRIMSGMGGLAYSN
jgi:hypothetical protein